MLICQSTPSSCAWYYDDSYKDGGSLHSEMMALEIRGCQASTPPCWQFWDHRGVVVDTIGGGWQTTELHSVPKTGAWL